MQKTILITGGERSGKSSFAQQMALKLTDTPIYLATARVWDSDFGQRIERHKKERSEQWVTIEEETEIAQHDFSGKIVVLDCITLWLTNIFSDHGFDFEKTLITAQNIWKQFTIMDFTIIVVTNEIGMGLHSQTEAGRKFVELQGRINQFIAGMANEVYLMVSGISVKIK